MKERPVKSAAAVVDNSQIRCCNEKRAVEMSSSLRRENC